MNFLRNFIMLGIAGAMFTACGDEPEVTKEETTPLELSKSELNFSETAQSEVITVTTSELWVAETRAEWWLVSPSGGDGTGSVTVSVTVNDSDVSRESYVNISTASETKVLVVVQFANESIGGDDDGDEGGETVIEGAPELAKTTVSDITVNAASFTSTINSASEYLLTESGFCIGTSENPTVENSVIIISSDDEEPDLGTYSKRYVGLKSNTTYYVRSYATNTKGTGYGENVEFKTKASEAFTYQTGTISGGYFSINESNRIAFSQGNLQYQASTGTWRFAEHQYDMIGEDNSNTSSSYSGWIDLFGWGTSGWNSGAKAYQPYSTSIDNADYKVGGDYTHSLTDEYANADWGVYNKISNGGNQAGLWRTLSYDEWAYVILGRTDADALKGTATVNGVSGMILLPDNWTAPDGITFKNGMNGFEANTYTTSEWSKMESNGAVFLPAAGIRGRLGVDKVGSDGDYWSASKTYSDAFILYFGNDSAQMLSFGRRNGISVRLVRGL